MEQQIKFWMSDQTYDSSKSQWKFAWVRSCTLSYLNIKYKFGLTEEKLIKVKQFIINV